MSSLVVKVVTILETVLRIGVGARNLEVRATLLHSRCGKRREVERSLTGRFFWEFIFCTNLREIFHQNSYLPYSAEIVLCDITGCTNTTLILGNQNLDDCIRKNPFVASVESVSH